MTPRLSLCKLVVTNDLERVRQLMVVSEFNLNCRFVDPVDLLGRKPKITLLQYCQTIEMLDLLLRLGLDCSRYTGTLQDMPIDVFRSIFEQHNGSLVGWFQLISQFNSLPANKPQVDYYNSQVRRYAQLIDCPFLLKDLLLEVAQFAYLPLMHQV